MKKSKSFKYQMRLNKEQEIFCNQIAGSCRYVWNRALGIKKQQWEEKKQKLSEYDINNLITMWKKELGWLKEVPSQALQQV